MSYTDTHHSTTSYTDYFRGMVMGILLLLILQAGLIYRLLLPLFDPGRRFMRVTQGDRPKWAEEVKPGEKGEAVTAEGGGEAKGGAGGGGEFKRYQSMEHTEAWPEHIVAFLSSSLNVSPSDAPVASSSSSSASTSSKVKEAPVAMSPTEPVHWMDVVVQRYFLALRGSELFKEKFKGNMNEKLNLKLRGNSFVSHIEITDLSLGEHSPRIHGARLLKGLTEDLAVVVELDLTYNGGGSVAIETTLAGGVKLPVRVYISALAGRLRVRCPSTKWGDMIGVAFVEDPGATFRVDSPITVRDNELVRSMVNKLLSSVVRKVFVELWVLPSWRTFFMPLMIPKLEDVMARMNAAKNPTSPATPTTPSTSSTEPKKTTRLWDASRTPLLRRSNSSPQVILGDMLATKSFPITHRVAPTDADKLEAALVPPFLALVRENAAEFQQDAGKEAGTAPGGGADTAAQSGMSMGWKTVRNRGGVVVEKKRMMVAGQVAEIVRGVVTIQCDAERVFAVLSNPEHNRQIEESYTGSNVVHHFDENRCVRQGFYQFNRQMVKEYTVYEVRKRMQEIPVAAIEATDRGKDVPVGSLEPYIVVFRSVG
ncbi:hypothetical protein HK104_000570, partial [Borealophlyctis nickersoniae]